MTGRAARWTTVLAVVAVGAVLLLVASCASDVQSPAADPEPTPHSASPSPSSASTPPTASPTARPSPAASLASPPPSTASSPTTPPTSAAASRTATNRLRLNRRSSGQTHTVSMGAVVTLSLPRGWDWDPVSATGDAVLVVGGSSDAAAPPSWEIRTLRQGRSVITADGRAICVKGRRCPEDDRFTVTLDVVP